MIEASEQLREIQAKKLKCGAPVVHRPSSIPEFQVVSRVTGYNIPILWKDRFEVDLNGRQECRNDAQRLYFFHLTGLSSAMDLYTCPRVS